MYKYSISLPKGETKKFLRKEWFWFSAPLFMSSFMLFAIRWSDKFLVASFLSPSALGIYTVIFSLTTFLLMFKRNISLVLLPLISEKFAQNKSEEITFLYKKTASWVFSLSVPFYLIMLFFSKEFLKIIYGDNYISGHLALIIISTGIMIYLSVGIPKAILKLHKQTDKIFYTDVFVLIINILLNTILLYKLQSINGAAIATGISFILHGSIFFLMARKYQKLSVDILHNIKFFSAGILSIIPSLYVFRSMIEYKFIAIIIAGITYIILYLIFILLLKAFRKEDIEILLLIEKKVGINLVKTKKLLNYLNLK